MRRSQKDNIQRNQVALVEDLDPTDTYDQLKKDSILTESDCERINAGVARTDRCRNLLEVLPRRGPQAYDSFKRALEQNYPHLGELLPEEISCSSDSGNVEPRVCSKCRPYIPEFIAEERLRTSLAKNCCLLLENVEANDLLDQFFQEYILNGEDLELIKSEKTRKDRCVALIRKISQCRESKVFSVFLASLRKKYGYIANKAVDASQEVLTTVDLPMSDQVGASHAIPWPSLGSQLVECTTTSEDDYEKNNVYSQNRKRVTRKQRRKTTNSLVMKYAPLDALRRKVLTQPYDLRSNDQEHAFDDLSSLINQGKYEEFKTQATALRQRHAVDTDFMCILDYLEASRYLHTADVKSAKNYIKSGLMLAHKAGYPTYFTLELLASKTRMYRLKKKHGKLQDTIEDAKMMIETDPTCCTGRGAGWIYLNDVNFIMVQMSSLNPNRKTYFSVYEQLLKKALDSCQRSMDHFKRDEGNDGPFGFGIALCRMVMLLLRCGNKSANRDSITPDPNDIELAELYLHELENSDTPLSIFLKVVFLLAKSDYHYRREHNLRALEYAKDSLRLSTENDILEFKEQAEDRIDHIAAMIDLE